MSGKRRKSASGCASDQHAAEHCDLLAVLRRELRQHYELPEDLPHQILALMLALNDQGESALRPRRRASSRKGGR